MAIFSDYSNKVIDGKSCIWLQHYGWAEAKPANEFKPGEKFLWNNGIPSTLKKIIKETPKSIVVIEECDGKEYERRLLKSRLVAIGR